MLFSNGAVQRDGLSLGNALCRRGTLSFLVGFFFFFSMSTRAVSWYCLWFRMARVGFLFLNISDVKIDCLFILFWFFFPHGKQFKKTFRSNMNTVNKIGYQSSCNDVVYINCMISSLTTYQSETGEQIITRQIQELEWNANKKYTQANANRVTNSDECASYSISPRYSLARSGTRT